MKDQLNTALASPNNTKSADAINKLAGLNELILQKLPVAVYTCDATGIISSYNDAAVLLWGRAPEIGKDLWCGSWKIYTPSGQPMNLDECPMATTLKEGRPVLGEEIIIERPDGRRLHVQPHPRPLFNSDGKLVGAVNMMLDVTELRHADQRILDSEERFRSLAKHAPVMIWMSDNNGDCIFVNEYWKKITGKSEKESLASAWTALVHPDDREAVYNEWQKVASLRTSFLVKHRLLTKDQDFIVVQTSGRPMYNASNEFIGHIGIMEDITLQENATSVLEKEIRRRTADLIHKNEELRRSEERYHKMIAEVQDYAILLMDTEGNIQNWNKGAQHIKGYTASEAVGMNFRNFYTPEDRDVDLPGVLLNTARIHGKATNEGWRVRKDGSVFWGSVVITSLHDDANNVVGFSKVTRDLTERKKAEDILKENAEEINSKNKELELMNQELASFAYVSSHDLQEPLRKIQTFSSRIVETEPGLSDKGKDYFSRMQNAAFRMQTLIEDLLAYSRTNTSEKKFETVDLNKVVADVKNDFKERIEEKHATVEVDELPTMEVIVFQFRQLLTNILSNALKFSKPDVAPKIEIHYESAKASKLNVPELDPKKNYHYFRVTDNGIGFDPEHKHKIFEVFQRLHGRSEYSGTGIGLAICKKIVENHGGFVQAIGEPGKGATFNIYIPVGKK
jgi:PAS domain S-box-containing protein